ncbi:hypothetical protein, partial [Klebsiella pneumoniae]|uniref:hypothetical protein n=1 Tax=Klebsiella pneumoniae TaxID=573 RepID=UPI003B981209
TLAEADANKLALNEEEAQVLESFAKMMEGETPDMPVNLREFMATPSAQILIPRVIVGTMREAAEPLYIGTKMLQKIRLKAGQSMIFPSIGIMR